MKISKNKLSKAIHFPIVQAQLTEKKSGIFNLVKSWATFKRIYLLKKDYILWSEYLKAFMFFPKGFLYDNASVPKLLGSIYKSDGLLLLGSMPHDFTYRYQGVILVDGEGFLYFKPLSQKECDRLLETLSASESGLPKSSKVARTCLSFVGGFTYKSWVKKGLKVSVDFEGLF